MREVKLIHNPFTEKSAVYFDGNKYGTSTISAYLNAPFIEWVDKIIEAISTETNDDYNLTFVGFQIYGQILKHFALKDSFCQKFSIVIPGLAESVRSRLGKLNQMCLSGFEIPRTSTKVTIPTNFSKEEIEKILPKLMKLAFCKMNFEILDLSAITQLNDNTPLFIISDRTPNVLPKQAKCFYFQIAGDDGFCGIDNGIVWYKCTEKTLAETFSGCIEMAVMTPLLHRIVENKKVDKYNPTLQSFYMLDKVQPEYLIKIPSTIELGQREKIAYDVLPKGCDFPAIEHTVLDRNIIQVLGNLIETVGTGDTFIDTQINGETVSHTKLKVYRRNRAKKIDFPFENLNLVVGEEISIKISYTPDNADNISLIKFGVIGSNISIKRQDERTIIIKALSDGESKITAELDGLKSRLLISVLPKLVALKIESTKKSVVVGDIIKLHLQPEPCNALVGDLKYAITPNNIARYDTTINAIVGQQRGNGVLSVVDIRNNVKSNFDFTVT